MPLTSSQAAVLKSSIQTDPTVSSFVAVADWVSVANNYNANTSNLIWRQDLSPNAMLSAIVGVEAVARPTNALLLAQMLLAAPTIDATNQNVRQQFGAIFPASSAASTSANLTAVAQRGATKYESLFITSQVTSVYGYTLTPLDVQTAMGA